MCFCHLFSCWEMIIGYVMLADYLHIYIWWDSWLFRKFWHSIPPLIIRQKFLRELKELKGSIMSLTLSGLWLDPCFRFLSGIAIVCLLWMLWLFFLKNCNSVLRMIIPRDNLTTTLPFAAISIWYTHWSLSFWDFQTSFCCSSVLCGAFAGLSIYQWTLLFFSFYSLFSQFMRGQSY